VLKRGQTSELAGSRKSGGVLTRRALLAAGAVAVQAQQRVGPPPHAKGPTVFLDYDQVELDAMYNQSVYAPNATEVQHRYASNSDLTRTRLGAPERVPYGPSEIEKLDIFRTRGSNAPIQIFIHGGAWRGGMAREYCFPADLFVAAGAHFLVPDFAPVQDVGGSLLAIEQQVRRAIQWTHDHAGEFGGDARQIYVTGHSSGAHLLGATVTLLPQGIVRGAILVSGMYDLRAPRLSSRSSYVKFDDVTEETLSPQRHIDKIHVPLVVAYGSLETPEFQRQSREFAAAVKAAGKPVETMVGENYNHFDFVETLANPYGILGRAALRMMSLG
jgi:arylformamidase